MKQKLLATGSAIAISAMMTLNAQAVDPAPMPQNPLQFYIGLHGGGAWGRGDVYTDAPAVLGARHSSGVLGALAGVQTRQGYWLFGAEADAGFFTHSKFNQACDGPDFVCRMKSNYHVRARLGRMISKNVDLFVAGGLALARVRMQIDPIIATSKTMTGLTIGGGADIGVNGLGLIRVEVLHDRYSRKQFFGGGAGGYGIKNWHDTTVRAAAIFPF